MVARRATPKTVTTRMQCGGCGAMETQCARCCARWYSTWSRREPAPGHAMARRWAKRASGAQQADSTVALKLGLRMRTDALKQAPLLCPRQLAHGLPGQRETTAEERQHKTRREAEHAASHGRPDGTDGTSPGGSAPPGPRLLCTCRCRREAARAGGGGDRRGHQHLLHCTLRMCSL